MDNKYFLTLSDEYSRCIVAIPFKYKSSVFSAFVRFQKKAERDTKILAFCSDEREFVNSQFEGYFNNKGIHIEHTNLFTQGQNGLAARYNLTAVSNYIVVENHLSKHVTSDMQSLVIKYYYILTSALFADINMCFIKVTM